MTYIRMGSIFYHLEVVRINNLGMSHHLEHIPTLITMIRNEDDYIMPDMAKLQIETLQNGGVTNFYGRKELNNHL